VDDAYKCSRQKKMKPTIQVDEDDGEYRLGGDRSKRRISEKSYNASKKGKERRATMARCPKKDTVEWATDNDRDDSCYCGEDSPVLSQVSILLLPFLTF